MYVDVIEEFLCLHCASPNPPWKFTHDSNALGLQTPDGRIAAVLPLEPEAAERIRTLENAIVTVECQASVADEPLQLFLTGCQISESCWRGLASATSDAPHVSRSFLESLHTSNNVIDFPSEITQRRSSNR